MNILVYRTGHLGDTVVSLPAMRAVRAAYPKHELILLTDEQVNGETVSTWEILQATGLFSRVFFYLPPSRSVTSWLRLAKLAREIRKLRPQVLFYFRDFPLQHPKRDHFFFRVLCGISRCYGLESANQVVGRRGSTDHLVRFPSEVDRLLEIVRGAGVPIPSPGQIDFGVPISGREHSKVDALWRQASITDHATVIALGPGSKMPAKRWPLEYFHEIARVILGEFPDCRLVVFGGSEDRPLGDAIQHRHGEKVSNLAGELSVLEAAEALRRCDVYIGNDTGVMHLAAGVGTPCVAIFSARDHPGRWEPYGASHVVLRKHPSCEGCMLEICIERDIQCLKDITVGEVLVAVRKILWGKTRMAPEGIALFPFGDRSLS